MKAHKISLLAPPRNSWWLLLLTLALGALGAHRLAARSLSDVIVIDPMGEEDQLDPDVAGDGTGRFLVVWKEAETETGFTAYWVDGDGRPTEVQNLGDTNIDVVESAVACRKDAGCIAGWRDIHGGLFAQLIGDEEITALLQPSATLRAISFDLTAAAICSSGSCRDIFVSVWEEHDTSGMQSGPQLYGRLLNPDSTSSMSFEIADVAGNSLPRIASDGPGSFTVVWEAPDAGDATGAMDIFALTRSLDEDPAQDPDENSDDPPTSTLRRLNRSTLGSQTRPVLAAPEGEEGTLFALWQNEVGGSGISGRLVSREEEEGEEREFQINTFPFGDQVLPDAAYADSGDLVLTAWLDGGRGGICGRFLDLGSEKAHLGPEIDIRGCCDVREPGCPPIPPCLPGRPRIAPLPGDRFAVVWDEADCATDAPRRVMARIVAPESSSSCLPRPDTLCLGDGRFRVRARLRQASGAATEPAQGERIDPQTGYFWLFNPANAELAVKIRPGCAAAEPCFAVQLLGLTSLGGTVTVTDTESGRVAVYTHPPGSPWPSRLDAGTFPAPAAGTAGAGVTVTAPPPPLHLSRRFRVEVAGGEGETLGGAARPLTAWAGAFSFSPEGDLDAAFKVLDRCRRDGHLWLYTAGLGAAFTATVTDTATGHSLVLDHPGGPVSMLDRASFPCD